MKTEASMWNGEVGASESVCFWKPQVRRFSEAYFFTEHPKEISLTFQEEL